jgi:hypothetical protein
MGFQIFSATRERNLVLPAKNGLFPLVLPAKNGLFPLVLPAKIFSPTRERIGCIFMSTRENL